MRGDQGVGLRPLFSLLSLPATAVSAAQTNSPQLRIKMGPQKEVHSHLSVNASSIFNDHGHGVRFVVAEDGFPRRRIGKESSGRLSVRRYLGTGMLSIFLAAPGQGRAAQARALDGKLRGLHQPLQCRPAPGHR